MVGATRQGWKRPPDLWFVLLGIDGERGAECLRRAAGLSGATDHRAVRRCAASPCVGLGDLLTQVQRRTNVLHIIFNNESLNFVSIEQQEAGMVPYGVDFKNPNLAKVAEALGAKGIRLEQPGDVKDALAEALAYKDGPVVVDAVVDRFALSLPSHVPFHTIKGYTLSMTKQVLSGRMDTVIKTIERNLNLV